MLTDTAMLERFAPGTPAMSGHAEAGWRRSNLGTHLFAANDRFVREKLATVHAGGFTGITDALLALFVNIDADGTRGTDIAARTGLTRQSVVELVDRAVHLGAVVRDTDSDNRRARPIRLTPHGDRLTARLRLGIIAAEQRFAEIAGDGFTREFKLRFGAYSALPVADAALPASDGARGQPAWRSGNVGRVFALASRRFAGDALGVVHRRDYREVTEVMLALFRNLDLAGTRLTEIAARAHMTKQSMRELVNRAVAQGLVERRSDPADGRAKIIAFTAAGLAMLDEMRIGLAEAEAAAAGIVGNGFLATTRAALAAYARA